MGDIELGSEAEFEEYRKAADNDMIQMLQG